MPLHIWKPIFPNKVIQFILCLDIRTCLSCIWYCLYHLLTLYPKVISVSCNNYFFKVLYLPLRYQFLITHIFYVIVLLPICCKTMSTVCRVTVSSPNSKQTLSHNPLTAGFLRLYIAFFSLCQFHSFHSKVTFQFLVVHLTPWWLWLCPDLLSY